MGADIVKAALDTPTKVVAAPSAIGGRKEFNPVGGVIYGAISSPKQIKPLTPTVQVGSIDTKTGKPISSAITDPDATLGSPAIVPVLKHSVGTFGYPGMQLTDENIAIAKKRGIDINNNVEWKPMAYMTAKVSTPVIDQTTGKQAITQTPTFNEDGAQIGYKEVPQTRDEQNQFLVPLDVQKGAYSKTISNINDYEKRAAEMNQDPGKYLNQESVQNSQEAAPIPVTQEAKKQLAKTRDTVYSRKALLESGKWTNKTIDAAIKKGMKVED